MHQGLKIVAIPTSQRSKELAESLCIPLATLDEQHERWNTTLRTYRFQLNYPQIRPDKSYVLTAVSVRIIDIAC